MEKNKWFFLLLRGAVAFAFFYAAISSLITPINWIGYFPVFLRKIVPPDFLLPSFSVFEIALSLWILSGKKLFFSSLIASFSLLGIIIFNFNQIDIIFRDVSILLTALALAFYSYKDISKK